MHFRSFFSCFSSDSWEQFYWRGILRRALPCFIFFFAALCWFNHMWIVNSIIETPNGRDVLHACWWGGAPASFPGIKALLTGDVTFDSVPWMGWMGTRLEMSLCVSDAADQNKRLDSEKSPNWSKNNIQHTQPWLLTRNVKCVSENSLKHFGSENVLCQECSWKV